MVITIILWVLAIILILAGLVGLVLPLLPGAPLLFVGLLLAAWAEGFEYVGAWTIVALAIMALLTYVVDFLAGAFGAKRYGASNRAIAGAAIGALVGLFFGIPGVLLGPFVGAVIGELSAQRNIEEAGRAGIGATVGLLLGVAAKLTLGFAMLGIFLVARFFV